ncbi:MAG: patatin-like phospholipase family protein, partial [Pseudomonadota bacterium]
MKRILALEGGGLRGIIEVAYLERLEALVKERRGPDTRLSDVFDLVGGASTGAILATSVALGLTVEEMKSFYFERATRIFKPSLFRVFGLLPAYSGKALEAEFRDVAGDAKIGGPEVKTRLALVLKRVDTGAPWIVSNLPDAPYFADPPDRSYIG